MSPLRAGAIAISPIVEAGTWQIFISSFIHPTNIYTTSALCQAKYLSSWSLHSTRGDRQTNAQIMKHQAKVSDIKRDKMGYSNQVRGAIFAQVLREGLPKEKAFKWRPEGNEAGSHVGI